MSLLGVTACGIQGEGKQDASLKTLSIDPSLKDKVALKACMDLATCKQDEVTFVHAPDGKTFERGYREDGFISFKDNKILWNGQDKEVEIGKFANNAVTALCSQEFEDVCDLELSVKHPNDASENQEPFYFVTFRLRQPGEMIRSGAGDSYHKSLLNYVIQSPNQENAGTCNLMAATGALEILLNQWKDAEGKTVDTSNDGASDLSEPYTINTAIGYGYGDTLAPIMAFNHNGNGAVLSKDFPFVNSYDGYDAQINWNRPTPDVYRVAVPTIKGTSFFGGTTLNDNTKWAVTVMDEAQVETVKSELRKNRPVLVTYNHSDFWHVVVVVGYDDELSENCQMVRSYYNKAKALYGAKVKAAVDRDGGCREKGVFYVRDSLGPGARSPKYSVRSYDWLKYLGNHIISVHQ
ncbi:hypothetical protein [Oligoflexus tunisiensis]|uniref:hypothetical protein n=1 Tax=Oligoflexus tunisiensis TaxID=708132 RepID=UPI001C407A24|nr:hypothetical protein [Oligoflexus tunisiensis]